MGARVEALADRYERANEGLIATVELCSEAQWRRVCIRESWPVGVTAHHVGVMAGLSADVLSRAAQGQAWPPISMEAVHQGNARHATEYANCSKEETIELLRRNGAALSTLIRGLRDEQLDHASPALWRDGASLSIAQFVEDHLVGHIQSHLPSMRAAMDS